MTPNLAEELERDYPEAWRPKPGDKLVGELVHVEERDGGYGAYPVLTIRDQDGKDWAWHGMHSVARGEVGRLQPRIGERLGVKYLGKLTGKTAGTTYHGWKVRAERVPGTTVDLAAYGRDDEGVGDPPLPDEPPFDWSARTEEPPLPDSPARGDEPPLPDEPPTENVPF